MTVTYITHIDQGTEAKVPLQIKHTTARLASDIVNHNSASKFTILLAIGVPGSGKTSGITSVLHDIHTKDDRYHIYHFNKDQFKAMDKTIDSLPKYQDCILIFDDVSYVMDELREADISKILHKLSVVREALDPEHKATRCIVVMLFHYSYAVPKGLRSQANFRIQFSITDEERENFNKTMGYYNRKRIIRFMRKYISQMRYGYFTLPSPSGMAAQKDSKGKTVRTIIYQRDKPFRIALVSNLGELHFLLYPQVSCFKCRPQKAKPKFDSILIADLIKQEGFARLYKNARYFTQFHSSLTTLSKSDARIMRFLSDMHRERGLDPATLFTLLKDTRKQPKEGRTEYFHQRLTEMEKLSMEDQAKLGQLVESIKPEEIETDINIEDPEDEEPGINEIDWSGKK